MKKIILLTALFGLLFKSCSIFYQNDFIETVSIGQVGDEKIIYSVYKTGIDNYRVEFIVIQNQDTTKLFDYYINDAHYSKEYSFQFKTSVDTLTILTPIQICKEYYKTKNGATIVLTNIESTKECED